MGVYTKLCSIMIGMLTRSFTRLSIKNVSDRGPDGHFVIKLWGLVQ